MRKLKKRHKITIGIASIAILMGIWMICSKIEQEIQLVDVYSYHENESVALTYGLNTEYINENNQKWKFGSSEFGQKEEMDLKGIQLMYTVLDDFEEDFKKIAQQYQDRQVWITLKIDENLPMKALKQLYEKIEGALQPYENIQGVYETEVALKLYKTCEIKWISQDVMSDEEIDQLYTLPEALKGKTKVIINDYILTNESLTLTDQLDVISRLYYSIPMDMKQIKLIFNQGNLNQGHYKIIELYNEILNEKWVSTQELASVESNYIKLNDMINKIAISEIMTAYNKNIEYVEYKVNDQSVLKSYRFPFKLEKNMYEVSNDLNKLKVIIKLKDKEKPLVQEYYLDFGEVVEACERSSRKKVDYPISMKPEYEKNYIPVLMYHEFKEVVGASDSEQSISVNTELFEEHIQVLLEKGYTPIHFKNLKDYFEQKAGLPAKPIIITTDDGYLSNYTIAYPILKKYNVPATYFITSAYVGVETTMPHFDWDEAREMETSGLIDIQSHTHGHVLLDEVKENEVRYQLSRSFARIEEELGKRDVKVLAYPQFLHNKNTIKWAQEEGIDLQITNLAKRKGKTEPFNIKRIHVANTTSSEELIEMIKQLTTK